MNFRVRRKLNEEHFLYVKNRSTEVLFHSRLYDINLGTLLDLHV